jgi:hypothetical protein
MLLYNSKIPAKDKKSKFYVTGFVIFMMGLCRPDCYAGRAVGVSVCRAGRAGQECSVKHLETDLQNLYDPKISMTRRHECMFFVSN